MIGQFSLWLVLAVWYLQRQRREMVTIYNFPRWLRLLDEMRRGLPIPGNKVEAWLVNRVLTEVDREIERVRILQLANVFAGGMMKMDL